MVNQHLKTARNWTSGGVGRANWARKTFNAQALYLGPGPNSSTICSVFAICGSCGAKRRRHARAMASVRRRLSMRGAWSPDRRTSLAKCELARGGPALMGLAARFNRLTRMFTAVGRWCCAWPGVPVAPRAAPHGRFGRSGAGSRPHRRGRKTRGRQAQGVAQLQPVEARSGV